jgi:glutamate decarboxylase
MHGMIRITSGAVRRPVTNPTGGARMALHTQATGEDAIPVSIQPQFCRSGETGHVPRLDIPDAEMDPDTAYQVVHDELMLDGNARLNLATFVSTWMEPQAATLMAEAVDKNMIDKDEYPRTAELEMRCVNMLSRLWNSPSHETATGCSTTGSSEACMLAGLALKWLWRERQKAAGKPSDKPNIVMGSNVQICWEKFARYWDVEMRLVPVSADATYLTPEGAAAACDENTIGVVAILGSTYDGVYEPVADIAAALDKLQAEKGLDVPMHVDGASGGFVAPFIDTGLEWDFRVPRVKSINTSGHKYGLVYPGVGWIVWRNPEALPEDLVFHVDYLGGDMPTFALNFSRPGAQVVAQYYNFLRLGRDGYRRVQQAGRDIAMGLAERVEQLGPFELISRGEGLPLFAFKLKPEVDRYTVYDVSEVLRGSGWLVPAYRMPENIHDMAVLRVVVRNGFSYDLGQLLLGDLARATERLQTHGGTPVEEETRSGFHH